MFNWQLPKQYCITLSQAQVFNKLRLCVLGRYLMYGHIHQGCHSSNSQNSLTCPWPLLNSFHWPFINEKQSMFTFTLAFFVGHRYFSVNFQPLSTFRGKRKKEFGRKHSQRKSLTITTACVRRRVSNWSLCLLWSILFNFSERKCISKSQRKLMNYKPENRIPWLFTDFDKFRFSLTFPWPWQPCILYGLPTVYFKVLRWPVISLLLIAGSGANFLEEILFTSCLWRKLNYFRKAFVKRSMESFAFGLG